MSYDVCNVMLISEQKRWHENEVTLCHPFWPCKLNSINQWRRESKMTLWFFDSLMCLQFVLNNTAKNTSLSPDFLVWKFCGKAQFSYSFGPISRTYAETVPFRKISTPGNQVKLWHFSQCNMFWRGAMFCFEFCFKT